MSNDSRYYSPRFRGKFLFSRGGIRNQWLSSDSRYYSRRNCVKLHSITRSVDISHAMQVYLEHRATQRTFVTSFMVSENQSWYDLYLTKQWRYLCITTLWVFITKVTRGNTSQVKTRLTLVRNPHSGWHTLDQLRFTTN